MADAVENRPYPARLAHIRQIGLGDPGWGQTQAWQMPGADPSVSSYDVDQGRNESGLGRRIFGGFLRMQQRLPLDAPTMTRTTRSSAQFSSLPAARFFQGYFSTGFSWLAPELNVVGSLQHSGLHMNFNPGQQGTKELHPATVYDPFPPGGALWPKAV